ncbi:sialin-like [Schistocerca serialis cubense]|uniref:sialin-like n=1 Tax=Schistocerca serialis cubense TaxID=2023355 RepID=UPI00214EDBA1|nr:sialin-like [Schistocerca serialis cubense]
MLLPSKQGRVPALGVRHLQALLLCIAHVLVFCLRTDMSVAVVVMANNTAGNPDIKGGIPFARGYSLQQALADLQKSNNDNESIFGNEEDSGVDGDMIEEDVQVGEEVDMSDCEEDDNGIQIQSASTFVSRCGQITYNTAPPDMRKQISRNDYSWSQSETSTILSSFFWGYVVMLAPAGWVADRFDAKNLLSASLILSGILTMLTEVAADTGGVVLVCDQLGTVAALVISGALAQSAVGWPSIFYLFGGLSILWGVILFWLGGNTPSGHKHISRAELTYIEESRKDVSRERKKFPTPWVSIFTSLPVFALAVATMTECWGFYTLLTETPTYLSNVLGFDIASNGLLSALPYVVNCVLSLSFSWIVNSAQKKLIFSKGALRKVANSIASWLPAATLVALSFIPVEDPTAAVILLTVAIGFNGMTIMGYQMNHIDIAPNFSGLMIGICGSIGTLTSIAAPLYVGAVVKENTIQEWRIVFLTAAGVFFVGNLIFVIFADGEVQPWNAPNYSRGKNKGVPLLGVRHLQALLLCIAHVLVFSLRTNMSVAVVVMANNTAGNPNIKAKTLSLELESEMKVSNMDTTGIS